MTKTFCDKCNIEMNINKRTISSVTSIVVYNYIDGGIEKLFNPSTKTLVLCSNCTQKLIEFMEEKEM